MSLSTQPYKGARDFYPEDKRLQKWMFSKWRKAVEQYGYEEYDAPLLEPTELYLSKTSEEIVNEQTYSLTDRGGRSVTIRTEMTPTVSRMVAGKRQELPYPLRWYSIPNLWRYERPQRGRLREFWQLNVDLFGAEGIAADFEMIQISTTLMKEFGATPNMFNIRVNNRKLVSFILEDYLKLDDVQSETLIRLIDKMNKIERAEFEAKLDAILSPSQREDGTESKIYAVLGAKTLKDLPAEVSSHPSVIDLDKMLALCEANHLLNVSFDVTLMRGFDYYTDFVFEVFDTHPENNRSMFGGGRYDGLIGLFGVEPVPTVGFGMGDVTLHNFLIVHNLMPEIHPETDIYVALVGDVVMKAQESLTLLREMGMNIAVDITGRKIDKQIKTATKKGIRYVLFVGDQELESGQFKLKDLSSGKEETHSLERIVSFIKDYRRNK